MHISSFVGTTLDIARTQIERVTSILQMEDIILQTLIFLNLCQQTLLVKYLVGLSMKLFFYYVETLHAHAEQSACVVCTT